MEDVYKLLQLKSALSGAAEELIEEFETTNANYKVAWDTLVKHYDQPQEQQMAIMHELWAIRPARDSKEARRVVNTRSRIIRQMMNAKIAIPTTTLDYLVVTLLPKWLIRRVKEAKPAGSAVELIELADDILSQKELLDHFQVLAVAYNPGRPTKPNVQSQGLNGPRPTTKPLPSKAMLLTPCAFCKGNHKHVQCSKFPSAETRHKQAKAL